MANKLYCVIFRRGGTENFTWHRSLAMSEPEVLTAVDATRCAGYTCFVADYAQSVSIGLPETYGVVA